MKKILLTLTLTVAAILTVRATPIYTDNFDYAPGSLVTNSAGNWISISSGGVSGNMMVTTNSMLLVSGARTEDTEHEFGTLYITNGPTANLYSSFTLKLTGAMPTAAGTYFCHFTGTNVFGNNGFRCRLYLSTNSPTGPGPDGQVWLSIAASNLGNTNIGTFISTNTIYTVVTRYVLSNGLSTMWINPSAESDPSFTSTEVLPSEGQTPLLITNGILNISSFGFRQATGEGTEDQVDLLRIGTTFNDVVGGNAAPSITGIPNQSIPMNANTGALPFTIGDDGGVGSLTLSNATSNPGLVPAGNIVFGGSGASRTVTVTPLTGQQGTATISIFVRDGVNVSSISFLLTVGAPTISTSGNLITYSNNPPVSTTVTVGDAETGASSVTVSNSWTAVNQSLISSVSVTGSGATRTVTVTPAVDQTGVATITLYARDPSFNLVQSSFVVSVSPHYGIIFSDHFLYNDYSLGTPNYIVGASGPEGDSPWQTVTPTSAGQFQSTNGIGAWITSSNAEDVAAPLNLPSPLTSIEVTNGAVLYTSFTINVSKLPNHSGDYFAHFQDGTSQSSTTFRDKVFIATNNAADPGNNFRVGIANAANAPLFGEYPVDLHTNITYTIVTRYNTGSGETVLWVAPDSQSDLSVTAPDAPSPTFLKAYGLRESSDEGTLALNNLVISTEFSDVRVPAPPSSQLQISLSGGVATVSWSNAGLFYLQSTTNILAPFRYTTNAGAPATSPYMTPATGPGTFYRTITNAP